MSNQCTFRVAGLLALQGFLFSGFLYLSQQFHGKFFFKEIIVKRSGQHDVYPPLSSNQSQSNISSPDLTTKHSEVTQLRNITKKHFEVTPPSNITTKHSDVTLLSHISQLHDVSQYVSFDDSIHDGRRLGNQLFLFTAVLFVAELSGRRPVLKNSSKQLLLEEIFKLNLERVDDLCPCYTIGEARHLSYDQNTENEFLKAVNKSILVHGFRQSWKYTMAIEHRLRRHLVFKDEILRFAEHFLQKNIPPGWKRAGFVRVGIHVRRGDTIEKSSIEYGYTVPNATYFEKAMTFFIDKYVRIQFIAMSDDHNWTMANIVIPKISSTASVNVTHSLNHSAGQDLAILSLCDHVIMSTGTYGWWGAWLAKGTTIYYKDWPRVGSDLYGQFRNEDFFPPSWIPTTNLCVKSIFANYLVLLVLIKIFFFD